MEGFLKPIAILIAIAVIVTAAVALEISVWNECRADHSFFYCLRMMDR
jgi:hypothetical protein